MFEKEWREADEWQQPGEPAGRRDRREWALGAIDASRLSAKGREGLSYARTLANGLAPHTNELARNRNFRPSGRTIRRRIVLARWQLEREPRRCARGGCTRPLPPQATARRQFCSGACRVAVFRGAERRAVPASAPRPKRATPRSDRQKRLAELRARAQARRAGRGPVGGAALP